MNRQYDTTISDVEVKQRKVSDTEVEFVVSTSDVQQEKRIGPVSVGLTKISEDVIVPSWILLVDNKSLSFSDKFLLVFILAAWIILLAAMRFDIQGGVISTGIATVAALFLFLLRSIPQKWIEFNRKDGFVYVWTSRKKRRLIGRWHIDLVGIKMNCRWISSGPKGQTSEHRYRIELFDNNPDMKNTSFWKFDNHPQRKGVPFFVLFDLFGDPHSFTEESDFALAAAITHQVEKFIRDFMAGRPMPESSSSTYTFSVPE